MKFQWYLQQGLAVSNGRSWCAPQHHYAGQLRTWQKRPCWRTRLRWKAAHCSRLSRKLSTSQPSSKITPLSDLVSVSKKGGRSLQSESPLSAICLGQGLPRSDKPRPMRLELATTTRRCSSRNAKGRSQGPEGITAQKVLAIATTFQSDRHSDFCLCLRFLTKAPDASTSDVPKP